jgi:UDP-N-acetyl-D-mannosaminuronate dehydrogenase
MLTDQKSGLPKVELNKTQGNNLKTTTDPKKDKDADFVIIAVPTPVTKAKDPDLEPIISASEILGKKLKKRRHCCARIYGLLGGI